MSVKISEKQRILFLCTHNSGRSQLAEALLRQLHGEKYEVYSAGIIPTKVDPYVIKALTEQGIDVSKLHSKHVNEYFNMSFDCVITLCDNVKETCPFIPGAKNYLHKGFEDPSKFTGTEDEMIEKVRKLRNEIQAWLKKMF